MKSADRKQRADGTQSRGNRESHRRSTVLVHGRKHDGAERSAERLRTRVQTLGLALHLLRRPRELGRKCRQLQAGPETEKRGKRKHSAPAGHHADAECSDGQAQGPGDQQRAEWIAAVLKTLNVLDGRDRLDKQDSRDVQTALIALLDGLFDVEDGITPEALQPQKRKGRPGHSRGRRVMLALSAALSDIACDQRPRKQADQWSDRRLREAGYE